MQISSKLGPLHHWEKGVQVSSKKDENIFQRGILETYQYALTTLKLFFSRTSSLNQSNLAQTIIWERTSSSLNERSCLFFRGDNNDNLKMNWELLKIFRTTKPNSTSLDTEHHLVEKDSSMFKWRATYFFLQGEVELK